MTGSCGEHCWHPLAAPEGHAGSGSSTGTPARGKWLKRSFSHSKDKLEQIPSLARSPPGTPGLRSLLPLMRKSGCRRWLSPAASPARSSPTYHQSQDVYNNF